MARPCGNTASTGAIQMGGQCIGLPVSRAPLRHALQSLSLPAPMPGMVMPVSEAMAILASGVMAILTDMAPACTADTFTPTVTNTASSNAKTCLGDNRAIMRLG